MTVRDVSSLRTNLASAVSAADTSATTICLCLTGFDVIARTEPRAKASSTKSWPSTFSPTKARKIEPCVAADELSTGAEAGPVWVTRR